MPWSWINISDTDRNTGSSRFFIGNDVKVSWCLWDNQSADECTYCRWWSIPRSPNLDEMIPFKIRAMEMDEEAKCKWHWQSVTYHITTCPPREFLMQWIIQYRITSSTHCVPVFWLFYFNNLRTQPDFRVSLSSDMQFSWLISKKIATSLSFKNYAHCVYQNSFKRLMHTALRSYIFNRVKYILQKERT